jgi:hypothetical protein
LPRQKAYRATMNKGQYCAKATLRKAAMRLHHCHARAYIALWRHCLTRFRHNAAHIEHPEAALIFALPYIGSYKNSLKKAKGKREIAA